MKRMTTFLLILTVSLLACGVLVIRHARRIAAPSSIAPAAAPARDLHDVRVVDAWQTGIRLDTKTNYTPDAAAAERLMEKLRREEDKQRPQEGRN